MTIMNFMKLLVTVAMVIAAVYAGYCLCNLHTAIWSVVSLFIGFALCAMWKLK